MKKTIMFSLGIAGLATAGLVAAPNFAQAQGSTNAMNGQGGGYGYEQVMQTKAKLLGMTEAELKTQLETKTLLEVAEAKGISADQLHSTMKQSALARWKDKGFTQAEIDSRLQTMTERQAAGHDSNSVNRGGGMRHNR